VSMKRRIGNLGKRIDQVEAKQNPRGSRSVSAELLLLMKLTESARLELRGLDPLPLTLEEQALVRRARSEVVSWLRSAPGWRDAESQTTLAQWEELSRAAD